MLRLTDFTMETQVEVVRTLLSRGINPSLKDQHDRYWQGSPCGQKKKCEAVGFMKRNNSIVGRCWTCVRNSRLRGPETSPRSFSTLLKTIKRFGHNFNLFLDYVSMYVCSRAQPWSQSPLMTTSRSHRPWRQPVTSPPSDQGHLLGTLGITWAPDHM